MKKYASSILTLAVVALFAWYGATHLEIFKSLAHVAIGWLLLITIGRLINIYTTGLFTKWTVEAFTRHLSHSESFVIAVLTAIGNFFGPLLGGLGIRAIYLKKYHNLSYSKFTATLIGYYQMMFQINSLMAIVALLVLPRHPQTKFALVVFGGWFVAFLLLLFIRMPKRLPAWTASNTPGRIITKILYDIEAAWRLLISKRKLLVQMFVLAVVNLLAIYLMNLVEFKALHIGFTLAAMALYTAIVQASMIFSITPGAVGIREGLLILVSSTIGVTNQQIIQVAILDRGIYFVLLGLLFMATRHSKLRRSLVREAAAVQQ